MFGYTCRPMENLSNSLFLRSMVACAVMCLAAFTGPFTGQCRAQKNGASLLLVVNQGDRDLSLIDPAAGTQVATVPVEGVTGHEVASSPDGKTAYVPIYGNAGVGKPGTDGTEIAVIDVASRKVVHKIDFDHGVRPHCAIYDRNSGMLYVTTELDKSISIIDPRSLKIVGSVPTGQEQSHMLTLSRDGSRGSSANVGPGAVSVLDIKARRTLKIVGSVPTGQEQSHMLTLSRAASRGYTQNVGPGTVSVLDMNARRTVTI